MRVALICAAGTQNRWDQSGGKGLKQMIELEGEPIIHRLYRMASQHADEVVTLVRDPDRPEWQGLNPHKPAHEGWMREMGKFVDGRPYWPVQGDVVVLYGDAYYTEATLRQIFAHRPALPTIYGRASGKRALETFAFRFTVEEAPEVERLCRECSERGLHEKGGPWRWHYWRCTGKTNYHVARMRRFATEKRGWVELPLDATDDFDKTKDLEKWRSRFAATPRKGSSMRYAKRDLFTHVGGVRRLIARAGAPVPDRYMHAVGEDDLTPAGGAASIRKPAEAKVEAKAEPQPSAPEPQDYSGLKQPQLKALLDERGIEYKRGPVRNADLVALLEASD